PHLSDWYERVKERPNYAKGIGEWLNDKYLELMKEKGQEFWPQTKELIAQGYTSA
ncbi:uncharacterized protein METZ01_LOCUS493596, partial [marine metagenome]